MKKPRHSLICRLEGGNGSEKVKLQGRAAAICRKVKKESLQKRVVVSMLPIKCERSARNNI
jgi:hypothetical protein